MSRWRFVVLVLGLVACTKPNPRSCADGTCTDPEFPFCDVGGELEGTPQTCIAVACDPGSFEGCRGDQEIRCNTAGTDFDLLRCDLGCDDLIGCRLCEPNETACTNGTVATCDAAGAVVASAPCPLGCFENEPRCREIEPSNGLGAFLDLVDAAPDLDLEFAQFDAEMGVIRKATQEIVPAPTFFVAGTGGNPSVRVFVVNKLRIGNGVGTSGGGTATAIVALSDIQIDGRLGLGEVRFDLPGCTGGFSEVGLNDPTTIPGTGGGGFGSVGGKGGNAGASPGGAGGGISGNVELVPLRGGCGGGSFRFVNNTIVPGPATPAGGAVQLVSRTKIEITGVIQADGQGGDVEQATSDGGIFFGGGAGGGILLEAPTVTLGDNAALLARGGPGAGGSGPFVNAPDTASFIAARPGGADGAGASSPAGSGANAPAPTTISTSGGGGGGGVGRIRINTRDAFVAPSDANVAGSSSYGELRTR